jgi:hypothetical protein
VDGWYRFLAPGSQPLYGYGTLGQAFRFAGRLNRIRNINYSTRGANGRGGTRASVGGKDRSFLSDARTYQ